MLAPILDSPAGVSVLEVGPGPKSVLGHLSVSLRRKIKTYTAFEPNAIFATSLQESLCATNEAYSPLPCLDSLPDIRRNSFSPNSDREVETETDARNGAGSFDVILFCHSMYGMKPKRKFIERALQMLREDSGAGLVIVFHRSQTLYFDGLASHRTASFPTGTIRLPNDDAVLDRFSPFIAGFNLEDPKADKALHVKWRQLCRGLSSQEESHPGLLFFNAPEIIVAFTRHATAVPELAAQVPLARIERQVKNREARLHRAASIVRPVKIEHIQECVRWARKHDLSLTVIGGGHSGHCLWPNVVSVDMGAFDKVHVHTIGEEGRECSSDAGPLAVVEAGCKTGNIIHQAMVAGLTIPLGARPSVGAGLWLQGGIGHLARAHGLACDAIVGATIVSVASGEVVCVGKVPAQYQPAGAVMR